ncbi:MAG TPA: deoxynucleoside kinase [Acidobacteriota bacterium]|nr:deoxynucleoside kinase [Acidobacteriota bacterium]HQG90114.1 deoxynucleoside kinase [Acidobacteriota bacterium]HQK86328.1 deoxynucleoside kinase [Acidobacteriota bacterium]
MHFKYLVIEGPIGVGKTTLAKRLADEFQGRAVLDQPWENPHITAFYEGQPGAAFKAQLFFLAQRWTLMRELTRQSPSPAPVISDFLLEKDKLFACLNLNDEELVIYNKLYEAMSDYLIQPDMVIYLKADVDTLLERIERRNVPMEGRIPPSYLKDLIQAYEHFFFQYQQRTRVPVLVLETEQIDFTVTGAKTDDFIKFLRFKNVTGLQYYAPPARG